jgi:hypothetical protein
MEDVMREEGGKILGGIPLDSVLSRLPYVIIQVNAEWVGPNTKLRCDTVNITSYLPLSSSIEVSEQLDLPFPAIMTIVQYSVMNFQRLPRYAIPFQIPAARSMALRQTNRLTAQPDKQTEPKYNPGTSP